MEASMRKIEALTDETKVLGITVKEWSNAFVGHFEESLAEMKLHVDLMQGNISPNLQAKSSTIDGE